MVGTHESMSGMSKILRSTSPWRGVRILARFAHPPVESSSLGPTAVRWKDEIKKASCITG